MAQYGLSTETQTRLDREYGFDAEYTGPDGRCPRQFPLIPVVPRLRDEIRVKKELVDFTAAAQVVDMGLDRCKRVVKGLLREHGASRLLEWTFDAGWPMLSGGVREPFLRHMLNELALAGFSKPSPPAMLAELRKIRSEVAQLREDVCRE
jgi:hypothetical protein